MDEDVHKEKGAFYQAAIQMLIHENAAFWNRQGVFVLANSVIISAIFLAPGGPTSPIPVWLLPSTGFLICIFWLPLSIHGLLKARSYHGFARNMERTLQPCAELRFLDRIRIVRDNHSLLYRYACKFFVPVFANGMIVVFLGVYTFILWEDDFMEIVKSIVDALSWRDLLPFLMGGVITWFVAWLYYMRASKDLKKEASDLLSLSQITLRALENAGLCKLNRDKDGKIKGLEITLSASISPATRTSRVNMEIEREKE